MKKRFSIIIVCLLAASCGTVRSVSQEKTAVSAMSAFDSTALNRTLESMVREEIASALQVGKLEDLQVVHEIFGEPDSTGMVPVRERTTMKYKSDTHTVAQADIRRSESRAAEERKDDVSFKTEAIDTKEGVTEEPVQRRKPVPVVVKLFAWVGGLSLLGLILWILKKFRII